MNPLMEPTALAPKNSVPVLHAQSGARELVMFGDRQIEDLVGFEERDEDRPAFQNHPTEIDFAKMFRIGENHFSSRCSRRSFNAGAMEAAPRLIAAHVRNNHPLCACLA